MGDAGMINGDVGTLDRLLEGVMIGEAELWTEINVVVTGDCMDALLIDGYALLIDGDALEPWTIGESLELLIQGDALLGEAEFVGEPGVVI